MDDQKKDKPRGPIPPLCLLWAVALVVGVMVAAVLIQGYFIALLKLELSRSHTMIMLRPIYVYMVPVYYYVGKRLGRAVPGRMLLLATLLPFVSFLIISLVNYWWFDLPAPHTITDVYILISYTAVSLAGGLQGKKLKSGRSQA